MSFTVWGGTYLYGLSHGPIQFLNICEMCLLIGQDMKEIIKRFIDSEWTPENHLGSASSCGMAWINYCTRCNACLIQQLSLLYTHSCLLPCKRYDLPLEVMISGTIRSMGTRNSPQQTSLNVFYFITEQKDTL